MTRSRKIGLGLLGLAVLALGADRLLLGQSAPEPAPPLEPDPVATAAEAPEPASGPAPAGAILAASLPMHRSLHPAPDVFQVPQEWEAARAAKEKKAEEKVPPPPTFHLSSVSFGERPLARINGRVFVAGDEVEPGWTLVLIERGRVVLESGDRRVEALLDPKAGVGS